MTSSSTGSRPNPRRRVSHAKIPEWTPCGYCFSRWATVWDHLQPWSKGGQTTKANLYPACPRCNSLLRDLSFKTIQEKREYVRSTLIDANQWNPTMEGEVTLPHLSDNVRENAKTSKVLRPTVPEKGLGDRQEKHDDMSYLPVSIRAPKTTAGILQPKVSVGGVAQSESGKPTRKSKMKERTCHTCLRKFTPRRKTQLFCDKVCQQSMGKGHDRLEQRLRELMLLECQRMKQELTAEITRQLFAALKRPA